MPNPNVKHGEWQLLAGWAIAVALGLMGFIGVLYIGAYSILAAGLPLNRTSILVALSLAAVVIMLAAWKIKRQPFLPKWAIASAMLVAAIILALSVWAAGHIYDTSYDGQVYHMVAVSELQKGWNPIYDPEKIELIWVRHYPKGAWLVEAAIYILTGHVETGKALNLITMASSCFAAFGSLLYVLMGFGRGSEIPGKGLRRSVSSTARLIVALLTAACAGFNPVIVTQLFTYYNDGLIGSLVLALVGAAVYYTLTYQRMALWLAAWCVIMLLNIKFTAIAYAGLLCAALVIAVAVREWMGRNHLKEKWNVKVLELIRTLPVRRTIIGLLASSIVALTVLGWNPYVFNTIKYGHPFYPLAGKHPVDIMTLNSPQDFHDKGRLQKFLISYTSRTEDVVTPHVTTKAQWWPIPWQDFAKVNVDTRVAGFGPLSPWLLAGTLAVGLLIVLFRWRVGLVAALVSAVLLSTVFINPEPWWARYVPQVWLVPIVVVVAGWASRRSVVRIAAILLLFGCGITVLKSADFILPSEHDQSRIVKAHLSELEGKKVRLYPAEFTSVYVRLQEWGIDYHIAGEDERPCKQPLPVPYATSLYCLEPGE